MSRDDQTPKAPADCASLSEIREAIDGLDGRIVALIARRSEYVRAAARFKTSESAVRDPARVKAVIESKETLAEQLGAPPRLIGALYGTMIDFFVAEEMEEWKKP